MAEGLDLHTALLALGFAALLAASAWHRLRLEHSLGRLPEEVRERLGLLKPEGVSTRRHRRLVARRLLLRGLPGWVPLGSEARRDLNRHRAFALAAGAWLVGVLPLAWGVWMLLPLLGLPLVGALALFALIDGPWGGPD